MPEQKENSSVGRSKRDSDLIRKLLKAGMTFRQIAVIANSAAETPPQVIFPEVPTIDATKSAA